MYFLGLGGGAILGSITGYLIYKITRPKEFASDPSLDAWYRDRIMTPYLTGGLVFGSLVGSVLAYNAALIREYYDLNEQLSRLYRTN